MQCVCPTPPRTVQLTGHVPNTLATATHVFVRHRGVCKPLQSPYDGPYPLTETEKFFTLNINGRKDTVSVDRLKPAHLDTTDTSHPPSRSQPAPTTRVTRSGRRALVSKYRYLRVLRHWEGSGVVDCEL